MYLVISLFGFEGRIWDLSVSVPDHCLSFYSPWDVEMKRYSNVLGCMTKMASMPIYSKNLHKSSSESKGR